MGLNLNILFNSGYKLLKMFCQGYDEVALLEGPDGIYEVVSVDYTGVKHAVDTYDLNTAFILFDTGVQSLEKH